MSLGDFGFEKNNSDYYYDFSQLISKNQRHTKVTSVLDRDTYNRLQGTSLNLTVRTKIPVEWFPTTSEGKTGPSTPLHIDLKAQSFDVNGWAFSAYYHQTGLWSYIILIDCRLFIDEYNDVAFETNLTPIYEHVEVL